MQKNRNKAKNSSKKKVKVLHGRVYILAGQNNTIILVTDQHGNKLLQSSAGACGMRGSKKSTPFAATMACEDVLTRAKEMYGLEQVDIIIIGVGSGAEAAARAIRDAKLRVNSIKDKTPVPHNGVRPKKKRRV